MQRDVTATYNGTVIGVDDDLMGSLGAQDVYLLRGIFERSYVIGSGGPGQVPIFNSNNWFQFQRPGVAAFRINGNPIKSGWQTIPSSATGTAQNVDYYSDFNGSGWHACRSSYNYHETAGWPEGRLDSFCDSAGVHCAQCTIVFPC